MIGFILYDKAQVEKENEKNQLIRQIICHNKEIKEDVLYIDGLYSNRWKNRKEIQHLWDKFRDEKQNAGHK